MIFNKNLFNRQVIFISIILLLVIIISFQSYFQGIKIFEGIEGEYTHYNNYLIFQQSFIHLIENKDLYIAYPSEHWDLYKYSPTYAMLMAPFAILPNLFGLLLWNALNALVLFIALYKIPFKSDKIRLFAIGFLLVEAITSIQNEQSNCLIAGLIIFAFIFLENKNIAIATLFIILTTFIKPFGIVAFSLFLFYPNKIKAVFYTLIWAILLTVLPLIIISPNQLFYLYQSWANLLINDYSISYGLSVIDWLHSWFGVQVPKNIVVLIGGFIFCLPLVRYRQFIQQKFRRMFLSSILIWVVIFNYKAESPTFVIAIAGAAIWFFTQDYKIENLILLLIAFIFTILSPTDIFPRYLRDNFVIPYVLKAVPCIIIWMKLMYDLMTINFEKERIKENILFKASK